MVKTFEGKLMAKGLKFGIVVSRFNNFIGERLLEGAMDALRRSGAEEGDCSVARVPGSFEIPLAAKKMVKSGRYDAIICLGAVIRGATPHFAYIAAEVTKGIASLTLESEVPISYGVLVTDTIVPHIGFEPQLFIGFYGILAHILKTIGLQFINQTNPSSLLPHIDNNAPAFFF